MNDFDHIPVTQEHLIVSCPGDDLAVALHRDGTVRELQVLNQTANRQCVRNRLGLAVDRQLHAALLLQRRASVKGLAALTGLLLTLACSADSEPAPTPAAPVEIGDDYESAPAIATVAPASGEPRAITTASPEAAPPSAPAAEAANDAASDAASDAGPRVAATVIAATIYKEPNTGASRLGYLRLGAQVASAADPVPGFGCKGGFYEVKPLGFACAQEVTRDLNDPLVRASKQRPHLDRPLPYQYGFVRATAPQYLRIPTYSEQEKNEFGLAEHLQWYRENYRQVQRVTFGANDVPLDERGWPSFGRALDASRSLSTTLTTNEVLGGQGANGVTPFWLDGGRQIPNVSGFEVPSTAIFADRVRRKTGLSFVDAFLARDGEHERRFAVTVDLRLIPATKIKPDGGSPFHGVALTPEMPMPFAFVLKSDATTWKLLKGQDVAKPDTRVPRRALVPLTGKPRIKEGRRFYQLARETSQWLQASDVSVVAPPPVWPEAAEAGRKWIDVSLVQQTMVLYEGKTAVYATLVSTGQDRLGDPKTTKATPRGSFKLQSKHIAAAMDSEENSTVLGGKRSGGEARLSAEAQATIERLRRAEKAGTKLNTEDARRLLNINKGRHPEYGVTMRRGSQNYELRDVPWIQYFASGYAIHGAYWHDVFGVPRSHGCINLAPVDARLVFNWTTPNVPDGWHGINVSGELGTGTDVVIRE